MRNTDSKCFKCGGLLPKKFYVIDDKKIGEECHRIWSRRNKLKYLIDHSLEKDSEGDFFTKTEYCNSSCLKCPFFHQSSCPLEEFTNLTLGRCR